MKLTKFKNILFLALPFIFVFIASLYQSRDYDLGWHMKYGEYFFTHGKILKENIFTTEMPGYKWVNTEWAVDIFTYFIYQKSGFFGITISGALLITLTFFFLGKIFKMSSWAMAISFPVLLYLEKAVNNASFRGQLFTNLFLVIFLWVLL